MVKKATMGIVGTNGVFTFITILIWFYKNVHEYIKCNKSVEIFLKHD